MADTRHPPDLWNGECLNSDIIPPQGTFLGPYDRGSIAAAVNLPKGITGLTPFHPSRPVPPTRNLTTAPETHSPNPPTPYGVDRRPKSDSVPHNPLEGITGAATPETTLQAPAHSTRSTRQGLSVGSYSRAFLLRRMNTAKRTRGRRIRTNANNNQSTITDFFPGLIPTSAPVRIRPLTPTPLLPRSLPSLGWHPDPSYRIQFDTPSESPFPFPYSPPESPTRS